MTIDAFRAAAFGLAGLLAWNAAARTPEPPGSTPPGPTPPAATSPAPPHRVEADQLTKADASELCRLEDSENGLPVIGLEVGDTRYRVELAATEASRRLGMGGRRAFPPGTAMLFVHPDDLVRRYWMKACHVDIDVAFLDRFGRITAMHRMRKEPPQGFDERYDTYDARLVRYSSRRPARYALEFPKGDLTRLGLKVGQEIPLPHEPLQAIATPKPDGRRYRRP